jgi:hypothetical protein
VTTPGNPSAENISRGWLWAVRAATLGAMAVAAARAFWLLSYREIAALRPWVPAAMLLTALALLPYLAALLLLATGENRKRGLAVALAWGALECLAALAPYWTMLRDAVLNLLPGNHVLVHHYFAGTGFLLGKLDALAAFAVAVTAARTYSAARSERGDRRTLLWVMLFAGLYFAILRGISRAVAPVNLPGIPP